MTIRADNDPKFYFRFKLIALGAIGFALYCLYDGSVAYPNQREWSLAYDKHYDEGGSKQAWDEVAREQGWPIDILPGEAKTEANIQMQFAMAALTGSIGLVTMIVVWRSRGRWIEATGTGITTSWGQSLEFDQVVSVDKQHWRRKGIAKVRYNDGRKRKFVLDDYKFKREPTDAILGQLESRIDPELIVGGPPESASA